MQKNGYQKLIASIALLSVLVCLPFNSILASDAIVLAGSKQKGSPDGDYLNQLFSEAFKRLDIEYEYKFYPPKRGSKMADHGQVDGETNRAYSYAKHHPNLIRIDQPVYNTGIIAVVTSPDLRLNTWDSLKGTKLKVNYRDGIMIAHHNLRERVPRDNLETVKSAKQGLKKLLTGRIDVFVDTESTLAPMLLSGQYESEKLWVAGVMEHITVHPYLHIKHRDLAEKLEATLEKIRAEGLHREFRERANFETLFSKEGAIVHRSFK